MSQYEPRRESLRIVEHQGPSGPYWMIHDDHGEYDGPYASGLDASRTIAFRENWNPDGERK
jgi:hypothetical protein